MKTGIAVFLRYPQLGRVKTRLAAAIGEQHALDIYEKLLAHTLAVLPADFANTLFVEPSTPLEQYRERFPGQTLVLQEGATLGDRMLAACAHLLKTNDAAMCIGTDCPEITAAHLLDAARALETHDAVLGPAADGGYWLLGLKRPEPRVFEGIAWSTSTVAAETEARFRLLGWRWKRLATLNDVDELADAKRHGLWP